MSVPEVTKNNTPQEWTFPCTDQHVNIYVLSIMFNFSLQGSIHVMLAYEFI